MAWEWVAPVASSLAAVAVGVAGIVATYKAGNRQQDTALAIVRQQSDVQVAVAREERQQRRIEQAYLELFAALDPTYWWVHTVYPDVAPRPEDFTMPPRPSPPGGMSSKEAPLSAYWSPRVILLLREWLNAVHQFEHAGTVIVAELSAKKAGRPSGIDVPAKLKELSELKKVVINADKQIREQVRSELLGQHDGHAEEVPAKPSPSS